VRGDSSLLVLAHGAGNPQQPTWPYNARTVELATQRRLPPRCRAVDGFWPYGRALGSYLPVCLRGIMSLVSLQLTAAQIVPALEMVQPVSRKLTHYK
jgi:hypothetical protein